MKMHEPIGSPDYAALLVRIPLGVYFVMAGLMKLHSPEAFVLSVRKFGVLPEPIATLYGIMLPYFEILAGGFLVIGIWTTLAALLTSLMLISFVVALGLKSHEPFNKDVLLLGGSLSLLFSGAGRFSVDRFRKAG